MHIWVDPVLAKRLRGDREASRALVRKARGYLGWLLDSMGSQTFKTGVWRADDYLIKAYVWKSGFGNKATVKIFTEGGEQPQELVLFLVVWQPEGIVLTPKSAAAPGGWGAPRRDAGGELINPPFGTAYTGVNEGGCKQVLLNCYEHNKYPDEAFKKGKWELAPLFYDEGVVVPKHRTGEQYPEGRFIESTYEKEIVDDAGNPVWFCHWPEEIVYQGEMKAAFDVIQGRSDTQFVWPMRGWYSNVANLYLNAVQSGEENPLNSAMKDGHPYVSRRFRINIGLDVQTVEGDGEGAGAVLGSSVVGADWPNADKGAATEIQLARKGSTWGLGIVPRDRSIWTGTCYWEGDYGRTSWEGNPARHAWDRTGGWSQYFGFEPRFGGTETEQMSWGPSPYFCVNGRVIHFHGQHPRILYSPDGLRFVRAYDTILGVGISKDYVRVVTLRATAVTDLANTEFSVFIWRKLVSELGGIVPASGDLYADGWELEHSELWVIYYSIIEEYPGRLLTPRYTNAFFSQDGESFILGKTRIVFPFPNTDPYYGEYYEYRNGSFNLIRTSVPGALVYAADYIENIPVFAVCGGDAMLLPSGKTYQYYFNQNVFCWLLFLDIQKDIIVDYVVTITYREVITGPPYPSPPGVGNTDLSRGRVALRVNENVIWQSPEYAMFINEHYGFLAAPYCFPETLRLATGRFSGDSGLHTDAVMPPIGMALVQDAFVFNIDCIANCVVANYKDELVVWVKQRRLPLWNPYYNGEFLAEEHQDQIYSTLDLEGLTGVSGLSKDIYPLGVV